MGAVAVTRREPHGSCSSDSGERMGAVAVTRGNAWGLSQRRGGMHAMTLKRGGLQKIVRAHHAEKPRKDDKLSRRR